MFQPFSRLWRPLGALVVALSCQAPRQPPPAVVEQFPQPPQDPLAFAPVPPILLRDVGFAAPQGAVYDAVSDVYLISNLGSVAPADNDGFISRVTPDGALAELRWIDAARSGAPLRAPRGMALVGDTLFVADLDTLRAYDRTSGRSLGDVAFPGSVSLQDIAPGAGGVLFVSDSGLADSGLADSGLADSGLASGGHANGSLQGGGEPAGGRSDAVYVVDAQRAVKVLAKGAELGEPTGLCVTSGRLLVAARGGDLFSLDRQGQRAVIGRAPGGELSGLVLTPGGRLLVSSAAASSVFITASALGEGLTLEPLITDLDGPGDLAYDPRRRQLIIPLTRADAVYIQELPGGIH